MLTVTHTPSGLSASADLAITVVPLQMTAEGIDFGATEGTTFSGESIARFSTNDPTAAAGDFAVNVDWGDSGSADTSAQVVARGDGLFEVLGSHTYQHAGAKDVTVTNGTSRSPNC